jgi:hypothetical protein
MKPEAMTDFEPPPPPGASVQAEALRVAFPDYQVRLATIGGKQQFEVVRRRGDGNPWCLISTDAREIWRNLKAS